MAQQSVCLQFEDNHLLGMLYGEQDSHLHILERALRVEMSTRGNKLAVSGKEDDVKLAEFVLKELYVQLEKGQDIVPSDVEAAIRLASGENKSQLFDEEVVVKTAKRMVTPYSHKQKYYVRTLYDKEVVIAQGPAGTGKTYLAVAVAVSMFLNHKVERIILTRPAVEAGEKLGFLPGDMKDKVDPYMQPLYDALYDMIPSEKVQKSIDQRIFEIAPLAFMRGRTIKNACVILDEAQNATRMQMKMFLTRLGEGSRMVINGDLSQIDLPNNVQSGLEEALDKLSHIEEIGIVNFDHKDVVRHRLVSKIITAYDHSH